MPPTADPGQPADRDEDRQHKLAALNARLQEAALAVRTAADWASCLRLAALMPDQEFANILLITAQQPSATMVCDYRQRAALGRQVRRREKGIEILAIPPPRQQQNKEKADQHAPERSWRHADRITQRTGQPERRPASRARPSR